MGISRRRFLAQTAIGMSVVTTSCTRAPEDQALNSGVASASEVSDKWDLVRSEFDLSDEYVHMSALLISSHPRRVRDAIETYRRELNHNPVGYLVQNNQKLQARAREAAAEYLECDAGEVALTDSTTMGLGLLYGGLRLEPAQEVLTTSNDYFATHEALRAASDRTGASMREIELYEHGENVSEEELVHRVINAVAPRTRAVALTWVHSSTGLKMPLAQIAEGLQEINRNRDENDRVLLCVDGVHGFGVESARMKELGADFFAAGCHKWLFGPRGTGVLWGRNDAWAAVRPTIPSFTDDVVWQSWLEDRDPDGPSTAARVTPGGSRLSSTNGRCPRHSSSIIGSERIESPPERMRWRGSSKRASRACLTFV